MTTLKEKTERDLWQSVFQSSPFAFGSWWARCQFIEGSNAANPGTALLVARDEETGIFTYHRITSGDLLGAFEVAREQGYDFNSLEDFDATDADAILQIAAFGKIIYG